MASTKGHGNPKWNRDETILALNLYLQCKDSIPGPSDPRVVSLSETLRRNPTHPVEKRNTKFRNPEGVSFKLQNLRFVATGQGFGSTSKTDEEVWKELGSDLQKTSELAHLIAAGITYLKSNAPDEDDSLVFSEGEIITAVHRHRERSTALRKRLFASRRNTNRFHCEICGCKPMLTDYGDSIFEGHHLTPLAAGIKGASKLSEMALLCANCHKMIHRAIAREKRWLSIPEAIRILGIGQVTPS